MKIENNENILCEYGCGQLAKYVLENGKKCCSKSPNSCQANKQKNGKLHIQDKVCPHCHAEFKQINSRVFANHVRWCKENPNHEKCCGSEFKQKIAKSLKNNSEKRRGKLKTFKVICAKCGKQFYVNEYENLFPSKDRYFCNITCAHSFSGSCLTEKSRKQIGDTLRSKTHIIECIECHASFETMICVNNARCPKCKAKHKPKYVNTKYTKANGTIGIQKVRYDHVKELDQFQSLIQNNPDISIKELSLLRKKVYRLYRTMCAFSFNLADYPNEFDFDLLNSVGMFSAANHGNNQNGVSRDHMYSCAEGFKHNISPLIISHPANCQLITQRKNASKHCKCSITLEQLLERIQIWEQKYGKYEKKNVLSIPQELFSKIQDAKICHPMNYDGYALIYETKTLLMKWWNVKDNGIPDGWQLEMPLELRLKHSHKKK